jgi:hypothetical protein
MTFSFLGREYTLGTNQLIEITESKKGTTPVLYTIPPSPSNPDPLERNIVLVQPDDSVVRFNWSTATNITQYIFRLYATELKENGLIDKSIDTNRFNVDLLQFEDREFFWEVIPIDSSTQREGVPSAMGHVTLLGSLNEKKNVLKPPMLSITRILPSGNTVYIAGNADVNSHLTINDQVVKIESDTTFVTNITIKGLGHQKVLILLRSPQDVVTSEVRYVDISDNDNE